MKKKKLFSIIKTVIISLGNKPYALFTVLIAIAVVEMYIGAGIKGLMVITADYTLFFLLAKYLFRKIGDRLVYVFTRDTYHHPLLRKYVFLLCFYLPPIALLLALISKLVKWNIYGPQSSSYQDSAGNTITKIAGQTPTIIISRGVGESEEHIVSTKLKKLPKKIIYE